ncbi:MAG: porin family protein, partial [Verrucomicrobia bacterium]
MTEEVVRLSKACRETERRCAVSRTNMSGATQRNMSPYPSRRPQLAFGALLAIAMGPAALEAQSDKTGEGELSAYAGAVFGMGAHPAVGSSTGTAFSRYATALIDVSYMPLNSDTLLSSPTTAAYRGSGLFDFALCVNVQIPVGRRWAPYGILGAGLLYNVYQAALLTPAGAGFADRSKTNFEFSTGGGVRYYVADNWGIRPEVRVFISGRNFTRISVGVFYDIDADWPFRIR